MDNQYQRFNKLFLIPLFMGWYILAHAPDFWEMWQSGSSGLLIASLYFVLIIGAGALFYWAGRRGMVTPWLWRSWAIMMLAIPLLTMVLDTNPAIMLRFVTLLFPIVFGVYSFFAQGGDGGAKIAAIFILFMGPFFSLLFFNLDNPDGLGPCHLFSDLGRNGCVRSIPVSDVGSVFYHAAADGDGAERLVRAYESVIWIEPLNRWEAVLNSRKILADGDVDYLAINSDGSLMRVVTILDPTFSPELFLRAVNNELNFVTVPELDSLIDLSTGQVIDQFRIDSYEVEEIQAFMAASASELPETVEPSDPKRVVYSEGGHMFATLYHDDSVKLWQETADFPNPFFTIQDPLNPEPQPGFRPTGEPYWSFLPEVKYNCVSISTDGRFLGGYGQGMLEIYDVIQKEMRYTVNLDASVCPVFSDDNQYLAVVQNLGEAKLYILEADTGETVGFLNLGNGHITHVDFSSDNGRLLISTAPGSSAVDGKGLIFDLAKLMGE